MGSDIYITDAGMVPEEIKSVLRPCDEGSLELRLGIRSVADPLPLDTPKEDVAPVTEFLSPRYSIYLRREQFEQLSDSIPISVVGSSPFFENVGQLREDIELAEQNGYRIMYGIEDDIVRGFIQLEDAIRRFQ